MLTIKSFEFNPIQENTYVLHTDKDACIIDPGCYFGNERTALLNYLENHHLTPNLLLNTHCHLDHVFGNKFIDDQFHLPLQIHLLEKPVLDFAAEAGLRWNMPFENFRGEISFLEEGDEIELGSGILKVLFTPGHSPGSICFYCSAQKFIIGGDVLFRLGIGRTDLPGGDHERLLKSIRETLFSLPDDVIVYPGHGEPTTIGFEKANNPFLH